MKIPAIKKLINVDLEVLQKAEEALGNEETPKIEVLGDDEGEKLTHVFGAIWVKQQVSNGMDEKEALRAFIQKVRGSIS